MTIRVTRVSAQVGGTTSPGVRVTSVTAQVAGDVISTVQVNHLMAQVAGTTDDTELKVLEAILQVATTSTVEDRYWTSQLGTTDSSLVGSTMALGVLEFPEAGAGPATYEVTASHSISVTDLAMYQETIIELTAEDDLSLDITDSASVERLKPADASDTITITQSNTVSGSWNRSAHSNVTVSHTHVLAGPRPVTASSTITVGGMTDVADSNILTRTASSTVDITDLAHKQATYEVTGSDTVDLTTSLAESHLHSRTATDTITITQRARRFFVYQDSIALTASNSITVSQDNNRYILKASAIALTASDTLSITQRAIFPIFLTASSTITITQTGDRMWGTSAEDTLDITQTVVMNHYRNLTASSNVTVGQSFTYQHFRDGILIGAPTCNYAPSIGEGSPDNPTPPRSTAPNLNRHSDVVFYYPPTSMCTALYSVTLRTPNFGDRDRSQYNRINRESRGGSLTIFRDPKWPMQRTLVMDFSGLCQTDVDEVLEFLDNTLGAEIGFRDWCGRIWHGVIVNPDTPVIYSRANNIDIAIEMEVDGTLLQNVACDTLSISDLASVEKVTP